MKKKVLFGVSLLFGLMMINSGLNKFFNYMPMPEMTEAAGQLMYAFMQAKWLFPLIAIVEIVAGVLFISANFRALGAIMIFPVIVGIVLFHLVLDPAGAIFSLILLAINGWAIFENRENYLPMIKSRI